MAAADPRVPEPHPQQLHLQPHVFQSNVSQAEYHYKHRLFFEDVRRAELRRRRRNGDSVHSLQFRKIYSFQSTDEDEVGGTSAAGSLSRWFSFSVDIPQHGNSISRLDSAEIHLQIIPKYCQHDTQVTLSLLNEAKTVYVDACKPRWETLPFDPQTADLGNITISCPDCQHKNVGFASAYLNVVTLNQRRTRYPRRAPKNRERKKCRLGQQIVTFSELPSFKAVISPARADIGRCRGVCVNDFKPASQHAFFKYDLHRLNRGPLPCCVASNFKDLEYLMLNGTKLERYTWPDAIATECMCH